MTTATALKSRTAEDTLARKSRDEDVISGGHLAARALANEGVDTVFTLCGGHIIDTYDGCIDEDIRIIDVRHEQVAAHAADGYARQTGGLGCVITTAGPGFTNALTGIATAFRSESPVLHIGGQGALTQHKMGSLQDLPHVNIARPITKFSGGVRSTERIADMVSMAASASVSPARPARATWRSRATSWTARFRSAARPSPSRAAIAPPPVPWAIPLTSSAWPTCWSSPSAPPSSSGQQVWGCRAHQEAWDLVRTLNIPTFTNGASRGLLGPDDPHYFHRTRGAAFGNADVIVIVGTPFDFRMGYGKRLPAGRQGRADRPRLPHRGQEPRRRPRGGGPSGPPSWKRCSRRPAPTSAMAPPAVWAG